MVRPSAKASLATKIADFAECPCIFGKKRHMKSIGIWPDASSPPPLWLVGAFRVSPDATI
ncbi:MAG: hypothetical protein EBT34_12365 [Acetobacteraceae bacterium]|jgi:hypothetical protein|nr:hypothetical protein [Acetobacteraceae bacterium]